MHSPISLHLPGLDPSVALAIARAVEADFEASEQAMSRFRPTAELVYLNGHLGEWTEVSPKLYTALATSLRACRRTGGLFDPRILRQLEAYGYAGASSGGSAVAQKAGTTWLERQPRLRRVRTMTALDLGGIGKGLGVRWGAAIARHVSGNFLLNAGGDLVALGCGPEGHGWQVGVEDPRNPKDMIAALHLPSGGAVCTSSVARRRWQHDGHTVHHLIDPRTGRPGGQGLLSVTVIGQEPAWSEIWSKALFLQGGDAIAEASRNLAALWVTDDGQVRHSDPAAPFVFWRARRRRQPEERATEVEGY